MAALVVASGEGDAEARAQNRIHVMPPTRYMSMSTGAR